MPPLSAPGFLVQTLQQIHPLKEEELRCFTAQFQPVLIEKGVTIEQEGCIPAHLYFVEEGCLRLFYNGEDGLDQTTAFATTGQFMAPFLSFVHQTKSREGVQAVALTQAWRVEHGPLKNLVEGSTSFQTIMLRIIEGASQAAARRADELATLSALQRYRLLMQSQPQVLQLAPVKQIASYLGIQAESLSRIRRQYTN